MRLVQTFYTRAAAFAFVFLNMGFLTAEKAQSVISSRISEASSTLLVDSGVIGQFNQTGGDQALMRARIYHPIFLFYKILILYSTDFIA